jgi:hypothetical protein
MFLPVITAPIVLAELIDFLIRRRYVNPPTFKYLSCKFDLPRLFNTIGVVIVSSYWPKHAALRLFVETIPIYTAVATRNRNNEYYRETTSSKVK